MSRGGMEPLYFGPETKRLFACSHSPAPNSTRELGIVLCHPLGDEYLFSHRGFRRLATLLSRAGFPTLRFDYYGCGDSAGDFAEVTMAGCTEAIAAAISELRSHSGCRRIGLVGLRLGGALSYLAGTSLMDVDALILWEPVLNGSRYLDEIEALYAKRIDELQLPVGASDAAQATHPLPEPLRMELRHLNLLEIAGKPARNVLILAYQDDESNEMSKELRKTGVACRRELVDGPRFWVEDINRVIVPRPTLDSIVTWFSEVST